ncbi:MAG: hypothetical protein U0360_00185 [Dehalococcoidia bacterium]
MTTPNDHDHPDERPIAEPPQRVSGMRVPESWSLLGKPPELAADADDAWRQTGFVLGEDLRLLAANLDLQVRLAATGYQVAARTMRMAAVASMWSRALLTTSDAAHLARLGSYQSSLGLVRQATEFFAAERGLASDPAAWEAFKAWSHRGYATHAPTRSDEIGLGNYFAGEEIARDPVLRLIYRGASDLARPNFGASALFAAAEANHQRYPLVFGDRAFHLGWAELILGWLLHLGAAQLHFALHASVLFPAGPDLRDEVVRNARAIEAHLSPPASDAGAAQVPRCRLEEYVDEDGRRRHLLIDFRRRTGDATKRILL